MGGSRGVGRAGIKVESIRSTVRYLCGMICTRPVLEYSEHTQVPIYTYTWGLNIQNTYTQYDTWGRVEYIE